MPRRRKGAGSRTLVALAAVIAMLVVMPAAAGAAPTVVAVSGTLVSPFAGCSADLVDLQRSLDVDYPNGEVEPYLAVNPTNPENLIAVWQQDRWAGGASRGNVVGVSLDGGDTWQTVTTTGSSACTGGPFWVRATDPWVTFGPDGTAYMIDLALYSPLVSLPDTLSYDGVLVARSHDGGLHWEAPATLAANDSPSLTNDKTTITADPNGGGFVYATWGEEVGPASGNDNPTAAAKTHAPRTDAMFARSTDGGATWQPPQRILDPGEHNDAVGNQVVVRPQDVGGQLVDVFDLSQGAANAHGQRGDNVAVAVSADHGQTWSEPTIAAAMHSRQTVDPDTGVEVRSGTELVDAAVDPTNGDIYAVWPDARFSGGAYDDVAIVVSTDDGRHWTRPVPVPRDIGADVGPPARQAFTPQVHVSADGRLAVSYYDFRNDNGSGPNETDYFVAQCAHPDASEPDLCAGDWVETRVTRQSFDIGQAPVTAQGIFLGDYTGLADVPGGFGVAFTMPSAADPASIYYTTVPAQP